MSKFTKQFNEIFQPSREADDGQVIVLLAAGMIVLIAAAGLALDGGNVYLNQRRVQNAADAAMLATVTELCLGTSPPAAKQIGRELATSNGYTDGIDNAQVYVDTPNEGPKAGEPDYIEVEITDTIQPFFIHVVYKGPLTVSARAVGACSTIESEVDTLPKVFATADAGSCDIELSMVGQESEIYGDVRANGDFDGSGSDCGGVTGCPEQGQNIIGGDLLVSGSMEEGYEPSYGRIPGFFIDGNPVGLLPPAPQLEPTLLYDIKDFAPDDGTGQPGIYAQLAIAQNKYWVYDMAKMTGPIRAMTPAAANPYLYPVNPSGYLVSPSPCGGTGCYTNWNKNWHTGWSTYSESYVPSEGLVYVKGSGVFNLTSSDPFPSTGQGLTIVVEDKLNIGGGGYNIQPYAPLGINLSLFAMGGYDGTENMMTEGECGGGPAGNNGGSVPHININSYNFAAHGLIYAPYGQAWVQMNDVTAYGGIIAYTIYFFPREVYILSNPSPPPVEEKSISIVE